MTSAVSRPPLHPLCSLSSSGRSSAGPALHSTPVDGNCCGARVADPPPPPDVVGGDQSDVAALGQQRTASALVMDVCFVETELKRLSRWSLAASEQFNASNNKNNNNNNNNNSNNNNNMQAIRCTASNCSCDCFLPGKGTHQARACDNCRHGWVAHALDKLHHLQHPPPSSRRSPPVPPFCGNQIQQHPFSSSTPHQPSPTVSSSSHHPLQNPVELVSANLAFDVASLMLFGAQAIPIRLKILLDRLFSVLAHDDVLRVLHGFGWTYDDYTRGYILQDPAGSVLDRWTLASRDEEPLILQQFLRFGETKAIAQHLLLQETGIPKLPAISNGPLAEVDLKRLIERRGVPLFKAHLPPTCTSSSSSPIATCNTSSVTTTASSTGAAPKPFHRQPGSSVSSLSPTGSPIRCGSPVSVSPLNKLQNMQPCDFRRDKSSPDAAARASENAATAHHNGSPISSPTTGGHLQQPHHLRTLASMHHHSLQTNNHSDLSGLSEDDMGYSDSDSLQESGAINLSQGVCHMDSIFAARKVRHLRKSANPMRRRWNPMVLSTLTTNPSTGKKRVQCHVCLKTFCDKGALKIHFSAVHLREMHKCTVEGCNMMFSSRRSRNRHSANPNPKLHTPNFRRKINPHDGRSSNPYPLIPASGMVAYGGGLSNNSISLPPTTLDLERPFAITGDPTAPALPLRLPVVKSRDESPPRRPSPATLPEPPQQNSPAPGDSGVLALALPKKSHLHSEDPEPCSDSSRPEEGMNLSLKDAALQHHQQLEQQVNNKGTRKRKSQHPTKCAAVESEDDDVDDYATTDDDSSSDTYIDQLDDDNGLLGSKSEDEEDEDMGETSDDLLDDSKDGRFFAAGSALLEKRLQERGRYSGAFPILQPAKREPGEEDEKENSMPEEGDKERPSMTAFNGSLPQEMTENPLRHLESLSLGAFTNMVIPRNHHHQHHSHHHSPTTGPPPLPRNSSGVSFHAPGLGLGSSSINSPTVEREPSVTPGYLSDPENSSTYGDGGQGMSMLPAFRDASMVGAVDIPVDKDNPRRCTACGKIFQNHFGVKTHYQNVHLKLMHKCTVEGCNAAFPSKRSRDRHSANLNLHRKLLSTTGDKQSYIHQDKPHLHGYPFHPAAAAAAAAAGAVVRDDFFSRLYDPQSLPLNFAELYQGRMPGDGLVGFPGHLGSSPLGGLPFHPAFLPPTGHMPLTRSSGLDGRDSPTSSLTSASPHSYTRSPLPLSIKEPVSLVRSRSPSPVRRKDEPTSVTLDEDLSPDSDGKYSCSLCLKKFHESVVLREHYEKAHTKELARCSVESCGKVFTSRTIRDHERTHRTSPADTRELEGAAS